MVKRVQEANKVSLDLQVPQDHKDLVVKRVQEANKVSLDLQVPQDHKDLVVKRVQEANKVSLDLQVPQELLVHQVLLGKKVRTIQLMTDCSLTYCRT